VTRGIQVKGRERESSGKVKILNYPCHMGVYIDGIEKRVSMNNYSLEDLILKKKHTLGIRPQVLTIMVNPLGFLLFFIFLIK